MFDQKSILIFFHLLALTVALGGSIFHMFFLPIILKGKPNQKSDISLVVRAISLFPPINFGMLVVVVSSGVLLTFNLYNKISNISSTLYLNVFSVKIFLIIIIFSIAAFQTFHLRFKISMMDASKIDGENLPKPFQVMQICSIINITLTTIVILLGIIMSGLK